MATDGIARSPEWMDPVWTDRRIFVYRDTKGLAAPQSFRESRFIRNGLKQRSKAHGQWPGKVHPVSIDNGVPVRNLSKTRRRITVNLGADLAEAGQLYPQFGADRAVQRDSAWRAIFNSIRKRRLL